MPNCSKSLSNDRSIHASTLISFINTININQLWSINKKLKPGSISSTRGSYNLQAERKTSLKPVPCPANSSNITTNTLLIECKSVVLRAAPASRKWQNLNRFSRKIPILLTNNSSIKRLRAITSGNPSYRPHPHPKWKIHKEPPSIASRAGGRDQPLFAKASPSTLMRKDGAVFQRLRGRPACLKPRSKEIV